MSPAVEKPLSAKDQKKRISDLQKELERIQVGVDELENLPLIHQNLQAKVQGMARVLAYLEGMVNRVREKSSAERTIEILDLDIQELKNRNLAKTGG